MTVFAPKIYQQQVLESVGAYFKARHEQGSSPSVAFFETTEQLWQRGMPYHSLSGFPIDMPYFWANLSDERCRFVMVKNKCWEWIESLLT